MVRKLARPPARGSHSSIGPDWQGTPTYLLTEADARSGVERQEDERVWNVVLVSTFVEEAIRLRQVRWEHEKVCASLSDASRQALTIGSPQILPTVHQEDAVHGSADRGQMGWPGRSARLTSYLAEYKKVFRRSLLARSGLQNIICRAIKIGIWNERDVSYLTFKGLDKRRINHSREHRLFGK